MHACPDWARPCVGMQALAELLKVTHRGYFIPPRPEKNPVEGQRATDDFVELRRHALEKYLIQLALHPAIVQSDVSTMHHVPTHGAWKAMMDLPIHMQGASVLCLPFTIPTTPAWVWFMPSLLLPFLHFLWFSLH